MPIVSYLRRLPEGRAGNPDGRFIYIQMDIVWAKLTRGGGGGGCVFYALLRFFDFLEPRPHWWYSPSGL